MRRNKTSRTISAFRRTESPRSTLRAQSPWTVRVALVERGQRRSFKHLTPSRSITKAGGCWNCEMAHSEFALNMTRLALRNYYFGSTQQCHEWR
jgi:hypothetical protein